MNFETIYATEVAGVEVSTYEDLDYPGEYQSEAIFDYDGEKIKVLVEGTPWAVCQLAVEGAVKAIRRPVHE